MPSSTLRTRPALPAVLAAVVGTALTLTGCTAEVPPTPPAVTQPADVTVDKVTPPPPDVPPTWPLTGVETTEVAERPALAVKVENPVSVRPQTGIDAADLVWEQVVEGGVTRFVVVYHSTVPEVVGPIRSVRPMDPAIVAPLRGVIAFSGGQPRFVQALADSGLQVVSNDDGDRGFWRRTGRSAPHNVFGEPATFLEQADAAHDDPPPPQFAYAVRPELATATASGAPTGSIALTMSTYAQPGWTWDAGRAAWLRTEKGVPATAASGARLAATNVVVLRVDLVDSGTRDPSGAVVPETVLEGTGDALVATGGRTVAATWTKRAETEPVRLTTADGAEVRLAPGVTWVELVPNETGAVAVD